MDPITNLIHHLSPLQLKALYLLSKSPKGIEASTNISKGVGRSGKALGGVFSSLYRRKLNGESLVVPWGRSETGKGLRWKLNEKIFTKEKLRSIISELINYD